MAVTLIAHDGDYGVVANNTVLARDVGTEEYGIDLTGGDYIVCQGNVIRWANVADTDQVGIRVIGADNSLIDNNIIDSAYVGIRFEGAVANWTKITNNMIVIPETHGIHIDNASEQLVISGNYIDTPTETGILIDDGLDLQVCDNSILDAGFHGISITDTGDSLIDGNWIHEPGQTTDDTYDGILLAGDSDENMIINNRIIGPASGNQPRYGINISASTCDDNSYLGNRTGPASNYGSGAYNDAGTGTINTWPAASAPQGDNLL